MGNMTVPRIERLCRQLPGGAAGINGKGFAFGRHYQPETITADAIHMGIDHRDGGRRGHHRLNRIAAVAQHR